MNPSEVKSVYNSITGKSINVLTYDDVIDNDLNKLFKKTKGLFILFYPFGFQDNTLMGHYVACLKNPNHKTVYYYDALGMKPDEYKKLTPQRRELYKEKVNSLIKHFLKYCDHGWTIDYNDFNHQSKNPAVMTCGLHSIHRLINKDLSNDDYDVLLNKLSKEYKIKNKDKLIKKIISSYIL